MKKTLAAIMAAAFLMLAITPTVSAAPLSKCKACHSITVDGKAKMGPNLFGVMDRQQGSEEGYKYGSYLQAQNAAEAVWTEEALRDWIADSKGVAKEVGQKTKMPKQKLTGEKADAVVTALQALK